MNCEDFVKVVFKDADSIWEMKEWLSQKMPTARMVEGVQVFAAGYSTSGGARPPYYSADIVFFEEDEQAMFLMKWQGDGNSISATEE
jgi:hypothetical protein